MKANELMIGDWVLFCENYNGIAKERPVRIARIDKDDDLSNYKPIPLTVEILEKNGFKFNELPFVLGWEQFGFTLYLAANGYRINCGQNIALNVDNVHELQHALKLCGVEKEIEL